ncbi:TetR family transcriptional regulator [Microtetraspora sp. NBRC 13810]|uniref:TetR/AcrR family transcriptional regulator n=1 Tax=Microtetraspora sp. NBRC 13810 TaxID=3030990 RepID=UPI0024A310F8|nr:TetR/AcrR family transcriptional regulator [Microtetraspora sp. NBRC 13810]GLW05770.1 TetR family transcriptional regulator [Microtetraspora sp. NBRC 13810]
MSPRQLDPGIRTALIDIAARLLTEEGPQALTTRRIATEAGSSTMAVYTYFGSMSELVREMVNEGFARLQHHLTHVERTDDPVADMALLGRAYRHNALANRRLYAVMFGGSAPGGFSLTENDRQHGRYTLGNVVECAARCIEAGRFRATDAEMVAHQMWTATHGLIALELGGYLIEPYDAERCFEAQLVSLMVGAGDEHESAEASVRASRRRLADEVASAPPALAEKAPAEKTPAEKATEEKAPAEKGRLRGGRRSSRRAFRADGTAQR